MSALYAKLIAWLVKWGALLALVLAVCGALFVGGCNHGKATQYQKDIKAMKAADDRANGLAAQVAVCAVTLQDVNAATAETLRVAAEQAHRAGVAIRHAAQAELDRRAAEEQADKEIAAAKRNPDCKRILEQKTCATLR